MISTFRILLFSFLYLIVTIGFSQETTLEKESLKRKHLKAKAREQINMLHDGGVLLVRLSNRQNAITALMSQGNEAQANLIRRQQEDLNRSIIKAFKSEIKFCKVYFFSSEHSTAVMKKEFESVNFIDENLAQDKSAVLNKDKFLTAEFSSHNADALDGTALIIMDEKFEKLKRPFPFFVNIRKGTPLEKAPAQVVKKMEEKLNEFYDK